MPGWIDRRRPSHGWRHRIPCCLLLLAGGGLPIAPEARAEGEADMVTELPEMVVEAGRAETARSRIAPALGASVTEIDREAIERLPLGDSAPLNQVLLQAPGVAGDAQGDIHVRGDHRNLQYRINGVTIPEAIGGFAPLFEARGLSSVSLITGALPAQFGFRTAGIIDLQLRSGAESPGGSAGLSGGSYGTVQPFLSYGAAIGPFEYYLTGSFLRSDRGFENPTPAYTARNNETEQLRGLGSFSYRLDDRTRLALIAGTSQSRFQVPAVPGQPARFAAFGQSSLDSADLRARQWQRGSFGVLALQHAAGALDTQFSVYARQSSVNYLPDLLGEMLVNGVAAETRKASLSLGLQADATWRAAEDHTLRFGLLASTDTTRNRMATTVLPLDAVGGTIDAPFTIADRATLTQQLYGLYLQDEWRLTERLTANLGARFDILQGPADGSQLSPRANLVWRATDRTTLSLGYARYFTPPPAELLARPDLALYAGTTAAPAVPAIGAVLPESAHYFNLGIRQSVGEALTLGAEAYYRQSRNLQDLGQFGSAYIFSPYNYRDGRLYGVELTASYRDGPWLAYGNLAYGRAEGRDPVSNQYLLDAEEYAYARGKYVRLDHLQTISGSAGLSYRPWPGGTVGGTLIYAGGLRKGFANSEHVTPYLTANLGIAQQFELPRTGRWTARLDVMNIGDRIYQLRDGTGIGVSAEQYGLRRAVFVSLSKTL